MKRIAGTGERAAAPERQAKPARLWKIFYVSIAIAANEILDSTVIEICARSEQHNARAGITGILTFHAGRFAQVLEGEESALRALMMRIVADPRHRDVKMMSDGPLAMRRFPDWSMAYRDPRAFMRDQIDDILEQTATLAEAIQSTAH